MTQTINTMSDAIKAGLQTTVIGLVIVFSVLIILMLVLMAMKAIFYKDPAKQAQAVSAPEIKTAAAEAGNDSQEEDEEALIAVLTAAVAASLNTSTYNLQIKSYRRVDQNTSAWNKAGLRETINSRF